MMADILDFNDAPSLSDKPISLALAYAAKGWPVFPCNPLNKRPLTDHGFKDATTDAFKIRAWWKQNPLAMVGIPTGKKVGFWVFDIDTDRTKGKDGIGSLAAHGADLSDLMDTVVGNTASGGYHVFFKYDPARPVGNARGSLKPHLDVRGEGGYIIAPGSRRADGQAYAWLNPPEENDFGDPPAWLSEAILGSADPLDFNGAAAPKAPAERVASIAPGTWHENTRDIVARMVREGASDDTIAAIAPRFTEPGYRDDQTIREFLTHARTAREKWGYRPAVLEPPRDPDAPSRFKILSIEELINVKPPAWRIDGIFPTHGSSTLYGAYETFKTFIALDMMLALATGRPWQGRELKPCSVLYIAGEGQTGLGIRVSGWLSAKGIAPTDTLFKALPEAIALPHPGDQDELLRAIDGMDHKPEVIVWDTVTRMSGGGSLNDEKDAQGYVRGSDRVRIATGAHMFHIGHSGKDKERGILGSTVLPAAMETIICVERKGDGITLINANPKGKQKDGPNFEDIRLRTQVVDFQHQDQALKTIVMMADEDPIPDQEERRQGAKARPQGANQSAVLAALRKAKGEPLGANRLGAMAGIDGNRLTEVTRALVAKGLIHETGDAGGRQWTLA
jgi:hypothetical protein